MPPHHVQLDELWANVKQAQQDLWVWVAVDVQTKIIPVLQLGARTQGMAYAVVHELKNRLKVGNVPVFSTALLLRPDSPLWRMGAC
jgi:IS1 family transposase